MEKENGGMFAHDPAVFYDIKSKQYYIYSTDAGPRVKEGIGGQIRRSFDLINFEYIGTALLEENIPDEIKKHTNYKNIWAPDIVEYNGEYRLYYSASTFGSKYSVIGLAVSDKPEGPFIPKDIIIKTTPDSPVNAIDANISVEEETGEHYLIYGSFWGGIRLLKLDKTTGLPAEEGFGLSIAKRGTISNTAIEGPYIRYNKETGYYYLFVSYDSLANMYNVRVGRSRRITGPYKDYHGNEMTDTKIAQNHVGLKITTGYSFKEGTGFMALGHNSVLQREDEWFLVCHARYENNPRMHTLNVRKMIFTKEGWPIVSPSLYSGERIKQIKWEDEADIISGNYLRIDFVQDARVLCEKPINMKLNIDKTVKIGDLTGIWYYNGMNSILEIRYNGVLETFYFLPGRDREEDRDTYVLTGMNDNGNCIWCKKVE